ncbi:MAG: 2-oxoacid:ferredoxin oxidoreductase subunit gamma [Deltaproteobacteria bacterium]|nr:MAG: 2-oxoacid:ferredoxin oxidoreductase subunit gamma [Deltaproteobacteria bacterium]
MVIKSIFAGFGGQGVLSMGYTLATAAMVDGKHVTYLPTYGAEVRGGTANCTVAIGNEEIASPVASEPEILVVLNQPSVLKFINKMSPGGTLFVNSSLVNKIPEREDIEVIKVPANELAIEINSPRSVNVIMLGALVAKKGLVSPESMRTAIEMFFEKKAKIIPINLEAFQKGYDFIKGEESS